MAPGFHLAFFLCLTNGLLISGIATFCPSGLTQHESRCFLVSVTHMNFADAELWCRRFGSGSLLASIHNQDEHYFIANLIYQKFGSYPKTWIGFTDAKDEGWWKWTDGSKTDFMPWAPAHPDDLTGDQNCAVMNFGGPTWDDDDCQDKKPFVCARHAIQSQIRTGPFGR